MCSGHIKHTYSTPIYVHTKTSKKPIITNNTKAIIKPIIFIHFYSIPSSSLAQYIAAYSMLISSIYAQHIAYINKKVDNIAFKIVQKHWTTHLAAKRYDIVWW